MLLTDRQQDEASALIEEKRELDASMDRFASKWSRFLRSLERVNDMPARSIFVGSAQRPQPVPGQWFFDVMTLELVQVPEPAGEASVPAPQPLPHVGPTGATPGAT